MVFGSFLTIAALPSDSALTGSAALPSDSALTGSET